MLLDDNHYCDAHMHVCEDIEALLTKPDRVHAVISAGDSKETEVVQALAEKYPHIHASYGVHPWQASQERYDEMLPWLENADIIGEIGLDSEWCEIPLAVQRDIFERQLAFASEHKKPVVLHTKGMEGECLERIRQYPNTYMVHWYSEAEHLQAYLDLGCYMSVGPFPTKDPAVREVAIKCPMDRLLIETDGLDALKWALGEAVAPADYTKQLVRIAEEIGVVRGFGFEAILEICDMNLTRFVQSKNA